MPGGPPPKRFETNCFAPWLSKRFILKYVHFGVSLKTGQMTITSSKSAENLSSLSWHITNMILASFQIKDPTKSIEVKFCTKVAIYSVITTNLTIVCPENKILVLVSTTPGFVLIFSQKKTAQNILDFIENTRIHVLCEHRYEKAWIWLLMQISASITT